MFDATVNLGSLLQILLTGIALIVFVMRLEGKLTLLTTIQDNFNTKLSGLENELKALASITIEIARQDERMTAQDIRIQTIVLRIEEMAKRVERAPPIRRSKG